MTHRNQTPMSIYPRLVRCLAATLPFVVTACAAPQKELTCPLQGGTPWTEVRSRHFVVKTDLPIDLATEVSNRAETARAALLTVLGAPSFETAQPTELITFERTVDFRAAYPRKAGGAAAARLAVDIEHMPVVVMDGFFPYTAQTTLVHELTHQVIQRHNASIPWWIGEGVAEYFSTLHVEDNAVIIGESPGDVGISHLPDEYVAIGRKGVQRWIPREKMPTLNDVFSCIDLPTGDAQPAAQYEGARRFIQVLHGDNQPSFAPRFQQMLGLILQGKPGNEAFAVAYKGVLMSEMEQAYSASLNDPYDYPTKIAFTPPRLAAPVVRPLPDDEVHLIWARLRGSTDSKAAGYDEAEKGLKETPGSAALLRFLAAQFVRGEETIPFRAEVERYLNQPSQDPRDILLQMGWFLRKEAKNNTPQKDRMEAALQRFVSLPNLATSPVQKAFGAVIAAALGKLDQAKALARASVEDEPSCAPCHLAFAGVLLALKELYAAEVVAKRGLTVSEPHYADNFSELLAKIHQAQKEAQIQSPPAP